MTAFFVISIQPGLPPDRYAAARDAAPGFVESVEPYPALLEAAGFADVTERDVTEEYQETAARWLRHAAELEAELRAALGDRVYEEKHEIRQSSFRQVAAGNLGRRLYTAVA